jgi:hypothetical protein
MFDKNDYPEPTANDMPTALKVAFVVGLLVEVVDMIEGQVGSNRTA